MAKLTVKEWINRYEKTTAAEKIALVYTLEKRVYMTLIDSLEGLPIIVCDRIDESGKGYQTLRLDLKQKDCLRLRDKGSALLGWDKDIFVKGENKGNVAERLVIEKYHGIAEKAGTAYYESGDAIIAGISVQIKYMNGTITKLDTIRKAWKNKKRKKG